jgi:superfamily I DNA/RNA helicase
VSYNQGPRLRNVLDIVLMFVSGLLLQVTFTNKAAQEMRKRLNVLLGPGTASRLILGEYPTIVDLRSG